MLQPRFPSVKDKGRVQVPEMRRSPIPGTRSTVFEMPAQFMKGVGPRRSEVLKRLGIETVADLLYHFPRRYEDRSHFTPIGELRPDLPQTVQAKVLGSSLFRTGRGTLLFQLAVKDATGTLYAVWFNQPYIRTWFKPGDEIILYGKVERRGRKLTMYVPEFEIVTQDDPESIHAGRIVPIYPSTSGLHQRAIRSLIKHAVDRYAGRVPEWLPYDLRTRYGLLPLTAALSGIHFPASDEERRRASERMGFDELLLFQLAMARRRHRFTTAPGIAHQVEGPLIQALERQLPFVLTGDQRRAMSEILSDMASPRPMHRLLHGDVGSGKTVVAAYALTCSAQSGHQAAVMAPTEILAEQHLATLKDLLGPIGLRIGLLTGSVPPEERPRLLAGIRQGTIPVVVGTHALLEASVTFRSLSLVVIDEQHKFGVAQRAALRAKGISPDVLVMTATPIPRTLALTLYGDLETSAIRELPPGRQPVKTTWVPMARRPATYDFVAKALDQGRQAYVVCPRIGPAKADPGTVPRRGTVPFDFFEVATDDLKAATKVFEHFRDRVFSRYRVGLLHGRLPEDEKTHVMREFKAGRIQLLVSTQVIEVGIDIPNATVMLVEQADRFGLAQLHQLRGRVGRGSFESHCILMADPSTPEGQARLDAMLATHDGFRIAEMDLKLRGPGEVFGRRQAGIPEIRLSALQLPPEWLDRARREAFSLIARDPTLTHPAHQALKERLRRLFKTLGPQG